MPRRKRERGLELRGGVWHLRVQFQGARRSVSTGSGSVEDARAFRARYMAALRAGRLAALDGAAMHRVEATVGEVVAAYRREVEVRGAPRRVTAQGNVAALRRILEVAEPGVPWEQVRVGALGAELLTRYAERRMGEARGMRAERSRRRSVVSEIAQARSVTSRAMMASAGYARLALPDLRGWMDARVVAVAGLLEEDREYTPAECELLARGVELRGVDPGLYLVWLLGYGLAMRAGQM